MSPNHVAIDAAQCKGCRLCVEACPRKCLAVGVELNAIGYQFARFEERECTACGFCYYVCPEPGAIVVYKGSDAGAAHQG